MSITKQAVIESYGPCDYGFQADFSYRRPEGYNKSNNRIRCENNAKAYFVKYDRRICSCHKGIFTDALNDAESDMAVEEWRTKYCSDYAFRLIEGTNLTEIKNVRL